MYSAMSTVAEVQAAVAHLSASDRVALFRWLEKDEAIRAEELAALRAALDEGDRDLAAGRFTSLETNEDFLKLTDDIKRSGRARLERSA